MATDPPDDPGSDLVAQVGKRSRTIIDAELRRLERRVPALRPTDLTVVGEALEGVAESLMLAPLRNARRETVPTLRLVFAARREARDS